MDRREFQEVIDELRALPEGEETAVEIEGITVERAAPGVLRISGATRDGVPMVGECFDPAKEPANAYPEDLPFLPDVEITTNRIGPDHRVSIFVAGPEAVSVLVAACLGAGWRKADVDPGDGGVVSTGSLDDGSADRASEEDRPTSASPGNAVALERGESERWIWAGSLPGKAALVMVTDRLGPGRS